MAYEQFVLQQLHYGELVGVYQAELRKLTILSSEKSDCQFAANVK